jgi:hypothetical protein
MPPKPTAQQVIVQAHLPSSLYWPDVPDAIRRTYTPGMLLNVLHRTPALYSLPLLTLRQRLTA